MWNIQKTQKNICLQARTLLHGVPASCRRTLASKQVVKKHCGYYSLFLADPTNLTVCYARTSYVPSSSLSAGCPATCTKFHHFLQDPPSTLCLWSSSSRGGVSLSNLQSNRSRRNINEKNKCKNNNNDDDHRFHAQAPGRGRHRRLLGRAIVRPRPGVGRRAQQRHRQTFRPVRQE